MDDNTIYIGKKPTMNYVLATVTLFNSDTNDVLIKARGKSISKAVDVAEIVRNRFLSELTVDNIQISTESLTNNEGRTSNVSSIEIFLKKGESVTKEAAPKPEPVEETPEPVAETPEPAAVTPEPVAETPEPAAVTPEPVAETPEPVEAAPEPVAATTKPVAPEPAVETTEPTDDAPADPE